MASSAVIPFPSGRRDPTDTGTDDDTGYGEKPARPVETLRRQFTEAIAAKTNENQEAAEAERYFHGVQLTNEQLKTYEDRGQPAVVYNRIKRKINTIMGILEKLRQDPKAYPRNPTQPAEDGAELATKVILYALGWDWNDLSISVGRRCAVRGIAGAELVLVQGDKGPEDPDIAWDPVDMRDFFYDPKSTKHDFSDARYMGTTRWLDLDEAVATWPDFEEELTNYVENGPASDWERGDERGRLAWMQPKERRIRIVDHWYMTGKTWHYCIYACRLALECGPSPHKNEKGESVHKFEMMGYDVDHDGDRYAAHRDLKGPQDEVNQRRSKALHQQNSRKVIADLGAVDDVEVARRELARVDGWVVKNPGKEIITEDQQANTVVQGNLTMLEEAKNEIDSYGPNPALIGTEVSPESGRAIKLLQAAGIAELGTYIQTYKNWKVRVYRKTWNACQQFWQAPRWVRVSDDENMQAFIQVNGWERDPDTGMPVVINNLAALDVDIILDEGPDSITSMEDTFELLLGLAKTGAQIPPEAIIRMSALPSSMKQQILQGLQPKPEMQQAIMLQFQQLQAQIGLLQSQIALNEAKAGQAGADAQKKLVEANTPPEGPQAQIDTPADLAKADLDTAKAQEIRHKIGVGAHLPQQPEPAPVEPGLFELNAARARREHSLAEEADAKALKAVLEARTINEAPEGMLTKPPPSKPSGSAP